MFCNQTESRWPSERFQDRSNERHRRKADGEEEDRENEVLSFSRICATFLFRVVPPNLIQGLDWKNLFAV